MLPWKPDDDNDYDDGDDVDGDDYGDRPQNSSSPKYFLSDPSPIIVYPCH